MYNYSKYLCSFQPNPQCTFIVFGVRLAGVDLRLGQRAQGLGRGPYVQTVVSSGSLHVRVVAPKGLSSMGKRNNKSFRQSTVTHANMQWRTLTVFICLSGIVALDEEIILLIVSLDEENGFSMWAVQERNFQNI